jgi:outer membrane protein TolC
METICKYFNRAEHLVIFNNSFRFRALLLLFYGMILLSANSVFAIENSPVPIENTPEYQQLKSAKILLKEKRYKEAYDKFQQFLTKYPQSVLAPEAINFFVLCRLEMSNASEYQLLQAAKMTLEEKRYKEAEDQFQKFLTKYPKSRLAPAAINYIDLCRLEMSKLHTAAPKGPDEPSKDAKNETNNTKMILKIPGAVSPGGVSDTLNNDSQSLPVTPSHATEQLFGFKEYLASALKTNPSHLINSADFKREYTNSVTNLKGYSFNISLDSGATAFYDNQFNYGGNVALNISKTLYDGGKKQILEKELEVVRLLSDARLIDSANNTTLIAVNLYATFYYLQEELSLLKLNFSEYQNLVRRIETNYQKGTRFSSFDYYSSKSLNLVLERALLVKKAELLKAETAFRQFANINTDRQIRLKPLSVTTSVSLVEIEKSAVLNNSSIKAARLQKNLQLQKIDERNAERGVTVKANSGLGAQFGSPGYVGTTSAFASGTRPIATVGLTASLPIYDGGLRKSNVIAEEFEALKQKLVLQRTTEDIIKRVNDVYADYISLEKDLEITRELVDLNRKRTEVAMERFDKGLEEYRSVREAWSDSILTEIEVTRQHTILQKLQVDMTILSGKKLIDI